MTSKAPKPTRPTKPGKSTKKSQPPGDDASAGEHDALAFEEAMEQLEDVVQKLEGGDVALEESLSAFEKGVSLVRTLHKRLDSVQEKIEQLTIAQGGNVETDPLEIDDD